jgi:hypothetical protein
MAYLNLSPMLEAMRARPHEFEMQGSYLHHIPSHHRLQFDLWGNARVYARCECAMLDVSREQSEEAKTAIAAWKVFYWEPRLAQIAAEKRIARINREFASHFRAPGAFRRFLGWLRGVPQPMAFQVQDHPDPNYAEPQLRKPAPAAIKSETATL